MKIAESIIQLLTQYKLLILILRNWVTLQYFHFYHLKYLEKCLTIFYLFYHSIVFTIVELVYPYGEDFMEVQPKEWYARIHPWGPSTGPSIRSIHSITQANIAESIFIFPDKNILPMTYFYAESSFLVLFHSKRPKHVILLSIVTSILITWQKLQWRFENLGGEFVEIHGGITQTLNHHLLQDTKISA